MHSASRPHDTYIPQLARYASRERRTFVKIVLFITCTPFPLYLLLPPPACPFPPNTARSSPLPRPCSSVVHSNVFSVHSDVCATARYWGPIDSCPFSVIVKLLRISSAGCAFTWYWTGPLWPLKLFRSFAFRLPRSAIHPYFVHCVLIFLATFLYFILLQLFFPYF